MMFELNYDEIKQILYALDLVLQSCGPNDELESIYNKFFSCIEVAKENGDDDK